MVLSSKSQRKSKSKSGLSTLILPYHLMTHFLNYQYLILQKCKREVLISLWCVYFSDLNGQIIVSLLKYQLMRNNQALDLMTLRIVISFEFHPSMQ